MCMEIESYTIEIGNKVGISMHISKEVMVKGAQTMRKLDGWNTPIDATTIKEYFISEHGLKK